jgi:hypothetical protein
LVILELNLAQQLVMLEAGLEQGLEQEQGLAILRPICNSVQCLNHSLISFSLVSFNITACFLG